jgi:hypothetical protein
LGREAVVVAVREDGREVLLVTRKWLETHKGSFVMAKYVERTWVPEESVGLWLLSSEKKPIPINRLRDLKAVLKEGQAELEESFI